ncbi:MAG: hypothetical protein J4452_03990 [Candidatus Aenigmarchaeota archaeon]|nr:hypothetical protein [Candidatus Aenigmarchaeota archaeon]
MTSISNDLRRQNGLGLGKFWREYFGLVPLVAGGLVALGAAAVTGSYQALTSLTGGSSGLYAGGLREVANMAVEAYKSGAQSAGEALVPGFVVGQILGYKFKMTVKPILGLK